MTSGLYICSEDVFTNGINCYFSAIVDGVDYRMTLEELSDACNNSFGVTIDEIREKILCGISRDTIPGSAESLEWDETLDQFAEKNYQGKHCRDCEVIKRDLNGDDYLHPMICNVLTDFDITYHPDVIAVARSSYNYDLIGSQQIFRELTYKFNALDLDLLCDDVIAMLSLRRPELTFRLTRVNWIIYIVRDVMTGFLCKYNSITLQQVLLQFYINNPGVAVYFLSVQCFWSGETELPKLSEEELFKVRDEMDVFRPVITSIFTRKENKF